MSQSQQGIFQTVKRWRLLPRRGWLYAFVLFLTVLVVLALSGVQLDASEQRSFVSHWLSSKLGRPVAVEGELRLRLGLQPALRVQGLRIGQPTGFGDGDLMRIGELQINLDLYPLWRGQLRAERLSARDVQLALRQQSDGSNNWTFPEHTTQADEHPAPELEQTRLAAQLDIRQILVEKLQVSYQAAGGKPMQLALDKFDAQLPADGKLIATASGRVQDNLPYSLQLSGGSLTQLLQQHASAPWPVSLQLAFAGSTLNVQGNLGSASSQLRFGLGTSHLKQFGALLGLDLPDTGAAGMGGLLRLSAGVVRMDELSAQLGRSAMSGSLAFNALGERPKLSGTLQLSRLDLRPFLGQEDDEEEPGDLLSLYRSLARARLDLQVLNRIDADLRLTVDEWISLPGNIHDASLALQLDRGKLSMPLKATLEGVPVRGQLAAQAASSVPAFSMTLDSERSDIGGLAQLLTGLPGIQGRLGSLHLRVASQGRDGESLMRSLTTQVLLRDSQLSYGNLDGGKPVGVEVRLLDIKLAGNQPLAGSFAGKLLGKPLQATLAGGSLRAALEKANTEFSMTAQAQGFAARVLSSVSAGQGEGSLSFSLGAARAGDVAAWLGLRSDANAPLALAGRISGNADHWQLDNLLLQAGRSSASVNLVRRLQQGKPYYRADVDVATLDAAELDGLRTPAVVNAKKPAGAVLDIPLLPRQLRLDDADIRVRVHGVQGAPVSIGDIGVDARFSDGYMQSSPFFAEIAGHRFEGALMLDTRSSDPHAQLWLFAKNMDVGKLARELKLAQGLTLTMESASLYLDSRSSRLSDFIANAQLLGEFTGGQLAWRGADGSAQGNSGILRLNQGSLSAAPSSPLALSFTGDIDGLPLGLGLRSASAKNLLDPRSRVPFELTLAAEESRLSLTGTLDRDIDARDIDVRLQASGPRLDKLDRLLRIAMPPWGPWSVDGSLRIAGSSYALKGLSLALGSSRLQGEGSLDMRSVPAVMKLDLRAPRLQLDDFRWLGWSPTTVGTTLSDSTPDQKTLRRKAAETSDQVQGLLSPQTLRSIDAELSVTVERVLSGADVLGSGRLAARLAQGRAVIGPVSVEMPGGGAKLSLAYEPREKDGKKDVLADLKIDVDHFDYGVIGRRLKPDADLSGRFSLHLDVRSQAPQLSEVLKHGSGTLDFAVWPQDMKAGIFDLWAVNLFLALLPTIDPKNESRVNCAIGRFSLNDGKLSQRQLVIDTSRVRVTGKTDIDLARESLHMRLQPQAKQAQFLSLATPLEVKGSFSDFSVGPNAGDVMQTIARFVTSIFWVPIQRLLSDKVPDDGRDVCGVN